jgi:biotin carboxyl carrier protein
MKLHVLIGEAHYEVDVQRRAGGLSVVLDGETHHIDVATITDGRAYSLLIDGRSVDVGVEEAGQAIDVMSGGRRYSTEVLGEREWLARSIQAEQGGGSGTVCAVMPGIVRDVNVAPGDAVVAGQVLFILEAMKMENEVKAEVDGTVTAVHVEPGRTVDLGDVVVEIE